MKTAEFDINASENVCLLTDYHLDGKFYPRGYIMSQEDIIIFKMFGITKLYGAVAEDGDIEYKTALKILAGKLCGNNTAYVIDDDGVGLIVAQSDGVLITSNERITKFNRMHKDVVLNIVEPYSVIKKGEILGKLEIRIPLMEKNAVDEILFKLSGNVALLQIEELKAKKTALLYTHILNNDEENKHFTNVVKKLIASFKDYQLEFGAEYDAMYQVETLADTLQDAIEAGSEVVFVLDAAESANSHGVISEVLKKIVDAESSGFVPVVGASDMIVAMKRKTKIVVLPYNYDIVSAKEINKNIKQFVLSEKFVSNEFAKIVPPNLNGEEILDDKYIPMLVAAKQTSVSTKKAKIAAVVLAAGIGSRSKRNKLLAGINEEKPLFMNAVNAAIASEAAPVFVVTGYHDEEMVKYLDQVDVNVIYNPMYRAGVKTSIDLGLSAVPNFCDGAMIIPADMPNLTAKELNKLISSFKKNQEKQLCVLSHKGVKANPIIWSRELYDKADIVPENAQMRPVFLEHSDYTKTVEISDANKLFDVNYPSDVEKFLA